MLQQEREVGNETLQKKKILVPFSSSPFSPSPNTDKEDIPLAQLLAVRKLTKQEALSKYGSNSGQIGKCQNRKNSRGQCNSSSSGSSKSRGKTRGRGCGSRTSKNNRLSVLENTTPDFEGNSNSSTTHQTSEGFFGQQQQQQQQKVDHPTTTSNNSPSKRDVLVIQIGKRKKESQQATATNSKKQKSDFAQNNKADFRCTTISRNNGSDGESDSKTKKEKRSVKLKISKNKQGAIIAAQQFFDQESVESSKKLADSPFHTSDDIPTQSDNDFIDDRSSVDDQYEGGSDLDDRHQYQHRQTENENENENENEKASENDEDNQHRQQQQVVEMGTAVSPTNAAGKSDPTLSKDDSMGTSHQLLESDVEQIAGPSRSRSARRIISDLESPSPSPPPYVGWTTSLSGDPRPPGLPQTQRIALYNNSSSESEEGEEEKQEKNKKEKQLQQQKQQQQQQRNTTLYTQQQVDELLLQQLKVFTASNKRLTNFKGKGIGKGKSHDASKTIQISKESKKEKPKRKKSTSCPAQRTWRKPSKKNSKSSISKESNPDFEKPCQLSGTEQNVIPLDHSPVPHVSSSVTKLQQTPSIPLEPRQLVLPDPPSNTEDSSQELTASAVADILAKLSKNGLSYSSQTGDVYISTNVDKASHVNRLVLRNNSRWGDLCKIIASPQQFFQLKGLSPQVRNFKKVSCCVGAVGRGKEFHVTYTIEEGRRSGTSKAMWANESMIFSLIEEGQECRYDDRKVANKLNQLHMSIPAEFGLRYVRTKLYSFAPDAHRQ